jgi:hypothetical protein
MDARAELRKEVRTLMHRNSGQRETGRDRPRLMGPCSTKTYEGMTVRVDCLERNAVKLLNLAGSASIIRRRPGPAERLRSHPGSSSQDRARQLGSTHFGGAAVLGKNTRPEHTQYFSEEPGGFIIRPCRFWK